MEELSQYHKENTEKLEEKLMASTSEIEAAYQAQVSSFNMYIETLWLFMFVLAISEKPRC